MEHRQLQPDVAQKSESSGVPRKRVKRRGRLRALVLRVPELSVLIILIACGYIVMAVFSKVHVTQVLTPLSMWLIIVGSFFISMVIAIIAVIAGIGQHPEMIELGFVGKGVMFEVRRERLGVQ